MAIIPSCSELIEASRRERVQDQATNFISGWMNSVIFLGEFLGPFIGGYFIESAQENIKVCVVQQEFGIIDSPLSEINFLISLAWEKEV